MRPDCSVMLATDIALPLALHQFQEVPLPIRQGNEAGIIHDSANEVRPEPPRTHILEFPRLYLSRVDVGGEIPNSQHQAVRHAVDRERDLAPPVAA